MRAAHDGFNIQSIRNFVSLFHEYMSRSSRLGFGLREFVQWMVSWPTLLFRPWQHGLAVGQAGFPTKVYVVTRWQYRWCHLSITCNLLPILVYKSPSFMVCQQSLGWRQPWQNYPWRLRLSPGLWLWEYHCSKYLVLYLYFTLCHQTHCLMSIQFTQPPGALMHESNQVRRI